jgi:hypothetical protein
MIARIWRGVVRTPDADTYGEYVRKTGLSGYAATAGNHGAWLLRGTLDDRTKFVTFTLWESLDVVKVSRGPSRRRDPKNRLGKRSHGADANPPRRPLTHRTLGVTGLDGAEVAPVPTAFVAVTVKV